MGSWGTAIFSEDFAADIRGEWRDAIIDGDDPDKVTARFISRWAQDDTESEQAVIFWLALAAAQMETGRLDPAVRDRALAIIDTGGDLARWREEAESLARHREKVLSRLAEKLRGPQPKPKVLRRATPLGVSFEVGDAVQLRSEDGATKVIAIVVSHHDGYPKGTVDPVVELVIWEEARSPTASELAKLPCVLTEIEQMRADWPGRVRPHLFILTTPMRKHRFGPHIGEVIARGVPRAPAGDPRKGAIAGGEVLSSWTTWQGLIQITEGEKFARDVDLTRQGHRHRKGRLSDR